MSLYVGSPGYTFVTDAALRLARLMFEAGYPGELKDDDSPVSRKTPPMVAFMRSSGTSRFLAPMWVLDTHRAVYGRGLVDNEPFRSRLLVWLKENRDACASVWRCGGQAAVASYVEASMLEERLRC